MIWALTASGNDKAPHLDPDWKEFSELSYLNVNDFSVSKKVSSAIRIKFKNKELLVSIFLSDSSEKYSDKKFRMNMTILLQESSPAFRLTPPGSLSQDIYFGDTLSFPKSESDLTKIYLDKIIDQLAQSLVRDLPGFHWKNKSEAIAGLSQMQIEKKIYKANIWTYKKVRNTKGGGILEFEILADPGNNPAGYRITNELLID